MSQDFERREPDALELLNKESITVEEADAAIDRCV
ncbi:Uncharacterised protein [Buttiauxella agrestis]|uniref:Uncharacterized protein n=1 Tax=Buttiauxella agrestis TaxID=82977 RepID=A0A381KPY3_9ENTR|nr:Uncharacterised protein [Buttiauxella agrestis]